MQQPARKLAELLRQTPELTQSWELWPRKRQFDFAAPRWAVEWTLQAAAAQLTLLAHFELTQPSPAGVGVQA